MNHEMYVMLNVKKQKCFYCIHLFLAQRSLLKKSFLSITHIIMVFDVLSWKTEPQGCVWHGR